MANFSELLIYPPDYVIKQLKKEGYQTISRQTSPENPTGEKGEKRTLKIVILKDRALITWSFEYTG
ncbi:MAG: hypothetical protein ACOCZR_01520 [Halanaerobiales bacterium]